MLQFTTLILTRIRKVDVEGTWNYAVKELAGVLSFMVGKWAPVRLKKTPWPQSASELYRPSDRRLSEKLVPTFCG
jgi:hypothetical protein